MNQPRKKWVTPLLIPVALVVSPLLVLLVIWVPLMTHYLVTTPVIDNHTVDKLRKLPSERVLDTLANMDIMQREFDQAALLVATAEQILSGTLDVPPYDSVDISGGPDSPALRDVPQTLQLMLNALIVPDLLAQAYVVSGDTRYLKEAVRRVLLWAKFEQEAWLSPGFLWNDHAIAGRIVALARIWRVYRNNELFDHQDARILLQLVARSAEQLAKTSHYTVRTNHGIMQNLGLLHVASAFPELPGAQRYRTVAMERLRMHMPFYVSSRGVVLEHSVGYQEFGIQLMDHLYRYLDVLDVDVPVQWRLQFEEAKCFLRYIRRPDGSVPLYGDTNEIMVPDSVSQLISLPVENSSEICTEMDRDYLDEEFGYASLWGIAPGPGVEKISHTFVSWANFANQAHKHADELGLLIWHSGENWLASSGYWPYGESSRLAALGWRGSNAPHFSGEDRRSVRSSRLLASTTDSDVKVLDLERIINDTGVIRRQIIMVSDALWLVLDSSETGLGTIDTVWTLMPEVSILSRELPGMYRLLRKGSKASLDIAMLGGEKFLVSKEPANRMPFTGLVSLGSEIYPSSSIVTKNATGSWSATVMLGGAILSSVPEMLQWQGPESWLINISDRLEIRREGAVIVLARSGQETVSVTLQQGQEYLEENNRITQLYLDAASRFTRFRTLEFYRIKISKVIGVLALGLVVVMLFAMRLTPTATRLLSIVLISGWMVCGTWIYYVYLV